MKLTIRNSIWETNSSSVHTISISNKGLRKCKLRPKADGYIHIPLHYFGKEYAQYNTQKEKLTYILTCVAHLCGCAYSSTGYDEYYSSYYFKYIEEAIKNYLKETTGINALGIKIEHLEDAEIDHQSIPYGDIPFINVWDEKSIQNFVFNSYITLVTDGD